MSQFHVGRSLLLALLVSTFLMLDALGENPANVHIFGDGEPPTAGDPPPKAEGKPERAEVPMPEESAEDKLAKEIDGEELLKVINGKFERVMGKLDTYTRGLAKVHAAGDKALDGPIHQALTFEYLLIKTRLKALLDDFKGATPTKNISLTAQKRLLIEELVRLNNTEMLLAYANKAVNSSANKELHDKLNKGGKDAALVRLLLSQRALADYRKDIKENWITEVKGKDIMAISAEGKNFLEKRDEAFKYDDEIDTADKVPPKNAGLFNAYVNRLAIPILKRYNETVEKMAEQKKRQAEEEKKQQDK